MADEIENTGEVPTAEVATEAPAPVVAAAPTAAPVQATAGNGEKQKIRGFVDLVKGSWEIFVSNWKATTLIMLSLFVLVVIVIFMVIVAGFSGAALSGNPENAFSTLSGASVFSLALVGLALVFFIVGMVVVQLSLVRSVVQAGEGSIERVRESLAYGQANGLSYFGVGLLSFLVILLLSLLLIIPGIWMGVSLSMLSMVFVCEGIRGSEVLKRSFALVKGYWWAVFGRLLLMGISVGLVSGILGYIPLVSLVVPFITTPLALAYSYSVYKDLVAIKG